MALVRLLGEQVNVQRNVDERTAFALEEILTERDYQDQKWGQTNGAPEEATKEQVRDVCLAHDRNWSGNQWTGFMEHYMSRVKPDMADPETRRMFVKVAALALAALRAS